jgi:hypothetical protein
MRRPVRALLLATLLTLASVSTVLAARPFHEKVKVDETTTGDDLCGVEVTTHVELNVNFFDFGDGQFRDVTQVRITWTNAEGAWLSNFAAGPASFSETLDGDILTVLEVHRGVHEFLRSADGITEAFDRGQIAFMTVIDLNDLENEADDIVLSFETVFQAGPHPEADADFALFCEVVTQVLG